MKRIVFIVKGNRKRDLETPVELPLHREDGFPGYGCLTHRKWLSYTIHTWEPVRQNIPHCRGHAIFVAVTIFESATQRKSM